MGQEFLQESFLPLSSCWLWVKELLLQNRRVLPSLGFIFMHISAGFVVQTLVGCCKMGEILLEALGVRATASLKSWGQSHPCQSWNVNFMKFKKVRLQCLGGGQKVLLRSLGVLGFWAVSTISTSTYISLLDNYCTWAFWNGLCCAPSFALFYPSGFELSGPALCEMSGQTSSLLVVLFIHAVLI